MSIDPAETPQQILQQSYEVHSAEAVELAIAQLAEKINHDLKQTPVVLMCVMTGGLYFSAKLLSLLKMPVQVDYVHASRYQHALKGEGLEWTKHPSIELKDKTVLLVDDILDEGITLDAVSQHCLALQAKEVIATVLVDKDNHINKPYKPDYICMTVPNVFIFGCGMDIYGWWRNLPEIRAI